MSSTETGSTNADLLARAAAGEDIDGAVLIAESPDRGPRQARPDLVDAAAVADRDVGRRRRRRRPSRGWGWLPLLTGVAVVDAVAEVAGVTAGLKWPNDVLVGDGKLAGILAEVAAPQPVVVVGLGLNVTEAPDPDRHVAVDARRDRRPHGRSPRPCCAHLAARIAALARRRRAPTRRWPPTTAPAA